jgi:uncharacterized FlaG/YvyC family protein
MDVKKIDAASLEVEAMLRKELQHPKPEAVKTEPKPEDRATQDRVDINDVARQKEKLESMNPRAGNLYNYTLDSEHDVVVKVRDMDTRREVKEIPSKAYQAFKRAYHTVVSKLIDRRA